MWMGFSKRSSIYLRGVTKGGRTHGVHRYIFQKKVIGDNGKNDIIEVISKYMEIDTQGLDIQITQTETEAGGGNGPALYANIPIKEVRFHR